MDPGLAHAHMEARLVHASLGTRLDSTREQMTLTFIDETVGRYKRPSERFPIAWDFVDDIAADDSLATQAVTAIDETTGADVSSTLLAGAAISGTEVAVVVQAGTDGHNYRVTFKATTSDGYVFWRVVRMLVRS